MLQISQRSDLKLDEGHGVGWWEGWRGWSWDGGDVVWERELKDLGL